MARMYDRIDVQQCKIKSVINCMYNRRSKNVIREKEEEEEEKGEKRENSAHAGRRDPYASLSSRRLPSLRWCPSPDGNVPGQWSVQILQFPAQTFHFLCLERLVSKSNVLQRKTRVLPDTLVVRTVSKNRSLQA